MPFAEDFSVFYDKNEHGTEAQVDGTTVVGILEREVLDQFGMKTGKSTFQFEAALVPYVEEESIVLVGIEEFEVKSAKPDGTGQVFLEMELKS